MTVTVSAKGWVVIPAAFRRKYGIRSGATVEMVDYGGVVGIVTERGDPIALGCGMLAGKTSLTRALRAERSRDDRRNGGRK